VYRRHDLGTGFGMERENFALDEKEMTSGRHHEKNTDARVRGGLLVVATKLL